MVCLSLLLDSYCIQTNKDLNMDRITSSYLEEFVAKYNIDGDESVQFEHFSNFSLLDTYSNDKFDFLEANISANGTLGIDAKSQSSHCIL